jgi:hypothetical protein
MSSQRGASAGSWPKIDWQRHDSGLDEGLCRESGSIVPALRQSARVHLRDPKDLAKSAGLLVQVQRGSPWQKSHAELFNSRLRAEMLDVEVYTNLADAQTKILLRRRFYNEEPPQLSLGYSTPHEAAARIGVCGRDWPSLHLEKRHLTNGGS